MDRDYNYICEYGNIKHCYRIHVMRMKERGEPYMTYAGFWTRIKKKGRPVYTAIHTPARRRKDNKGTMLWRVKKFFKGLFK